MVKYVVLVSMLISCGAVEFFNRKPDASPSEGEDSQEVIGLSLGDKATGQNNAALQQVYAVSTSIAPAAIRPDPDTFPRLVLRQFHEEGTTMARSISRIERFRLLHGGQSVDLKTPAAETFDATSVLANMKIAEQLCQSLVSPVAWQEVGWQSILPGGVDDVDINLRFLYQRLTGQRKDKITTAVINSLTGIYTSNKNGSTFDNYIAPCTAVMLDAHAMLF